MKKFWILIIGVLIGLLVAFYLMKSFLPQLMIKTVQSKYEFEETVSRLEEKSYEYQWEVLHVYDIGDCLFNQGFNDTYMKVQILSICQPVYSYTILQEDTNKKISAIMPCRIAVYEDREGDVFISRMNIGLFSHFFSGTIGDILKEVAKDDKLITSEIINNQE